LTSANYLDQSSWQTGAVGGKFVPPIPPPCPSPCPPPIQSEMAEMSNPGIKGVREAKKGREEKVKKSGGNRD